MHRPLLLRAFVVWLPIAVATSGIFIFAYWGVQQEYRLTFNDPQMQLAEDTGSALASGAELDSLIPTNPVDISTSLAPWVAVYTVAGIPLASSGKLNGAPPTLPAGVFDTSTWRPKAALGVPIATQGDETFFTWQPEAGVRQAVVLVHVDSGGVDAFVASGRNMREVENEEGVLTEGAALAWGSTELGTLVVILILLALGWL